MNATVTRIRRYPVKSMGGEDLTSVVIDDRGISGDRWFAVRDEEGHFASGKNTRRFRRHDGVFLYAATTVDETVQVTHTDGGTWAVGDAELNQHLSAAMGQPMRIAPEGEVPHQDDGSISLVGSATLQWCADTWGIDADPRRLRVNIVIDTDEPFIEESWLGRDVELGSAKLRVVERVPRCRTIDLSQDGVVAKDRWLRPLAAERDMCAAVYLDVVTPGHIALGDRLVLLPAQPTD